MPETPAAHGYVRLMRKPRLTCRNERPGDTSGSRGFKLVHLSGRVLSHGPGELRFDDEAQARVFAERFLCDAPAWRCVAAPGRAAAA